MTMLPAAAHAQSYQCRIDGALPVSPGISRPADQPPRVRPVEGFVLALSWSPEYCKGREDDRRAATQCGALDNRDRAARRIGDFGFVLHGLWPETRGPDYPQWCAPVRPLAPAVVRRNLCIMPSARLINRQWAKHGRCLTDNPQTYFRISRTLFDAVRFPDMDRLSRQNDLSIGSFRNAFAAVNPGLEPDMIRVQTNRRGWLREVRLCLARNYRPRRCPMHLRRSDDGRRLNIWRGY
ncbi:MAG: ribonuclease T [Pseudomonadota bacterium]